MDAYSDSLQRIARLTPLVDVLKIIEQQVTPVAPREMAPVAARGRVLAADVVAPGRVPPAAAALRDGVALAADLLADAGPYAPAPLSACGRVDAGEPLPTGCDAVAPLDAVEQIGGGMQAVAPVGPGEGVLPAGGDVEADAALARAGANLSGTRAAVLAACGVASVSARVPGVRLCVGAARREFVATAYDLIAAAIEAAGAAVIRDAPIETGPTLGAVLEKVDADAIIAIGGTGSGQRDSSVTTLRRHGRLESHGIAIAPGETAAFGFVGPRPVLLLPGRLDAALAAWLLIGRMLVRRLAGCSAEERTFTAKLARKVTSTLGLAELVLVRRHGDEIEPLARGHLPLTALAGADGWVLVAAENEGFSAGATVTVRPLP